MTIERQRKIANDMLSTFRKIKERSDDDLAEMDSQTLKRIVLKFDPHMLIDRIYVDDDCAFIVAELEAYGEKWLYYEGGGIVFQV